MCVCSWARFGWVLVCAVLISSHLLLGKQSRWHGDGETLTNNMLSLITHTHTHTHTHSHTHTHTHTHISHSVYHKCTEIKHLHTYTHTHTHTMDTQGIF